MMMTASVQAQSIASLSAQQAQVEKQKAELQSQIKQLNSQISQQETSKKDVLDDLKESESAISEIGRKLDRLLDKEQEAKDDLLALKQEEETQQQILDEQLAEFSEQIYTQYVSGVSPWTALLSGKDAQKISRDLGYLAYISKARAKAVQSLNKEIERLASLKKKTQARRQHLASLSQEAKEAKSDLEKEQNNYQAKLRKIEGELKQRRQQAGQLKQDEQRLGRLIAGIEKNIRAQREALRQAEIRRQKQAEERRKAIALERARKAELARTQAQKAQEQLARAKRLRETARQAQMQAIAEQRAALNQVKQAQKTLDLASLTPAQQEQARVKLQEALQAQQQTELQLSKAREQAEDAEIERAKARIAQEKAREAQRLLHQAKEDERLAQQAAEQGVGAGLSRGAPWPLRGNLLGRFGQTRPDTGDVWRGILINASAGAPVKAIASGSVVFANWVKGYGNLIIIDHGNDYLSVYGYNQSLSRHVGDSVRAGEVVARAGSTGGQVEPALYFEIRQGTRPVDPMQWLAR